MKGGDLSVADGRAQEVLFRLSNRAKIHQNPRNDLRCGAAHA